jgi:hypothetical protein
MAWRYQISTGKLWHDSEYEGSGYSGRRSGLNNPALTGVEGVGPIPTGNWTIADPLNPPDHLGPLAMPLEPSDETDTRGRSAFFIHGDNAELDHSASHGCIILGRALRQAIIVSGDRWLEVIN